MFNMQNTTYGFKFEPVIVLLGIQGDYRCFLPFVLLKSAVLKTMDTKNGKASYLSIICPGTRIASDSLKGRVYEVSLADLQNDEVAFRKFRLICEDVQGRNCLTNFHGMTLTTDKTRS